MTRAALARKSEAAPATKAKASSKNSGDGLRVGPANDVFEQEAEWTAERVVSAARPTVAWSLSKVSLGPNVQRQCSCGGKCDECEEKLLQRDALPDAGEMSTAPASVHDVLRGSGAPLDSGTRSFMESRFGYDFGRVRIHTDAQAAQSARSIRAHAYTVGDHVVFGSGQFAPESMRGLKLLAHELAHTLQQKESRPATRSIVQRAPAPGWTGSSSGLNAAEKSVGKIRRIPIEGLKEGNQQAAGGSSESAKGRAIILLNAKFDASKTADILFFFHGHNDGLRAGNFGNRDSDLYSLESQVEAAGKEQVIGILPQGTRDSGFGDLPPGTTATTCNGNPLNKAFNADAYLKEVFDTLKTLSVWTTPPSVGSVLISGHSGAGELINQGLLGGGAGSSLPQKLGTLKEVSLIDAINGPCEFVALQGWLENNLKKELADLSGKSEPEQQKYLKTSLRFRSYYEDNQSIGDYYKKWNVGPLPTTPGLLANRKPLKEFLDKWFTDNAAKLPQSVLTIWKNNYVVTYMGQVAHDDKKVNVINAPTPGGSTPVTESLNVLPKRESGADLAPTGDVSRVVDALRSPARPLAEREKQWAERHFQHDFSQVRLHLDSTAAGSARSLQSLGYTVGEHIILDPRRYDPETSAGRRLLAHELTHVLQQGSSLPPSWKPSRLKLGRPEDRLERAADYHAEHPGPVLTDPFAGQLLQRAPAEGQLAKDVCETTANPPKEQLGECNYARPENCPTYESWLETFTRLKTFRARATPSTSKPAKGDPHVFTVLGGEAGSRLTDKPDEKALAKDPAGVPFPTTGLKPGETFIDHPTDSWVKSCLPDNLRATAYQLPADCADIAIILRHVWLSAHHRTQTLQVGNQTWVIGDESGGPGRKRALSAISDIGSQTVTSLVAPYSDAQGKPLLSFEQLAPLLHPGDILVWEHRENGLTKPRTGGHTLTITSVRRDQAGKILGMSFLQGNEPIFGDRCLPGEDCDPDRDDKGKILKERKLPDTKENRKQLGEAPGRRIEVSKAVVSANELDYSNPDLDVPAGKKGDPPRKIWGWGQTTILLSAGPSKAANRPAMEKAPKGTTQETRISDWIKSFASAGTYEVWQAFWESMLLEVRAFLEGGREVPEDQARRTGEAAGNKLWALAKQPKGTLGDESHFARLRAAKKVIDWITSRVPASTSLSSDLDKIRAKLTRALGWIEESFELAARGAGDIHFGSTTPSGVKVLLTGFDPFDSSGNLSAPAKGIWNPSGAAILALDNQSVPVKSSRGKAGNANVQGVILPVNFEQFKAGGRGLVEGIVSSKAPDLDAAITVSMDPNIGPSEPVRLERYAVGVHEVEKAQPSGAIKRVIEPIPAAAQGTLGEGIIESNAPVDQIAAETEKKSKGSVSISKPNIGENITFRFATDAAAKAALDSLGGVRSQRDITISDAAVIRQITSTMVRQSNGTDITFQAKGRTFTAGVVSGPGGNFLSNEVSYRMLRLIKQQNLPEDPVSFHVHTQGADPIPQDTSTPDARKDKADKSKAASGLLSRLVETLKRIIAATAKFILDRRAAKKTP